MAEEDKKGWPWGKIIGVFFLYMIIVSMVFWCIISGFIGYTDFSSRAMMMHENPNSGIVIAKVIFISVFCWPVYLLYKLYQILKNNLT